VTEYCFTWSAMSLDQHIYGYGTPFYLVTLCLCPRRVNEPSSDQHDTVRLQHKRCPKLVMGGSLGPSAACVLRNSGKSFLCWWHFTQAEAGSTARVTSMELLALASPRPFKAHINATVTSVKAASRQWLNNGVFQRSACDPAFSSLHCPTSRTVKILRVFQG
jgi:hypothetical protein